MSWLLDTNHWIALLKGKCPGLANRLRHIDPAEVWLCSIVKEELIHGAHKYGNVEARLAKLQIIFDRHESAPYDDAAAVEAAKFRHELELNGNIIGPHDLQIAGLARSRGWVVVTANTREFKRLKGLRVEDWTVEEL